MKLAALSIGYLMLSGILGFIISQLPPVKVVKIWGKTTIIVVWPFVAVFGIASVIIGTVLTLDLPKQIISNLWWPFLFSFPLVYIGAQKSHKNCRLKNPVVNNRKV